MYLRHRLCRLSWSLLCRPGGLKLRSTCLSSLGLAWATSPSHTWLFMGVLGIELRSPCFRDKNFTSCTFSLAISARMSSHPLKINVRSKNLDTTSPPKTACFLITPAPKLSLLSTTFKICFLFLWPVFCFYFQDSVSIM